MKFQAGKDKMEEKHVSIAEGIKNILQNQWDFNMPHSFRVFLMTESLNISKTDPTVWNAFSFLYKSVNELNLKM